MIVTVMNGKMPLNLMILTLLALLISFALGLTPDADTFSLYTDDIEKISQINLLELFQFLKSEESQQLSFDGTGLRLKAIHFHHRPEHLESIQNGTLVTHDHDERAIGLTVRCPLTGCATLNNYMWNNPAQAENMPFGIICKQIDLFLQPGVQFVSSDRPFHPFDSHSQLNSLL